MKPKPSKPRNPVVRGMLNTPKRNAGQHGMSQRKKDADMEKIMAGEVRAIDAIKLLINHRPWETEPNYVRFKTPSRLRAEIKRHPTMLHLCGYLHIPASHPIAEWDNDRVEGFFDVHGGVTFLERNKNGLKVGFDCAHPDDFSPGVFASVLATKVVYGDAEPWPAMYQPENYRDIAFVKEELRRMDTQAETILTDWMLTVAKQALREGVSLTDVFAKKEANNVRTA